MDKVLLHKIYGCVILGVLIVLGILGYNTFKAHDAWKDLQRDLAVSQERIKQNKQAENQASATITTASNNIAADTAKNSAIDAETKRKLADIDARTSKQLSSDDVRAILKQEMPKLDIQKTKDFNGNDVLAVADTQANRDILNQTDGAYKSCKFSLDDCQQKQVNLLDSIKQKDDIIAAQITTLNVRQSTINELQGDLKRATSFGKGGNFWSRTGRVAFPIGCAGLAAWGASKAGADAKATGLATGAAGGVCAIKFHF